MNPTSRRAARLLAIGLAAAAIGPLVGCAAIVALEPAAGAAEPECANVTVRLPGQIGDLIGRETNAQGTGAWGDPTAVVLHCGVPAPPPTSTLLCVTPPGGAVDWLMDPSEAPTYLFTSYGRTPAVSVAVDNEVISGVSVLDAIDVAVSQLPHDGSCIGLGD